MTRKSRVSYRIGIIAACIVVFTPHPIVSQYQEIHCRHFFYGYPAGTPATNDLIIRDGYALSSNDETKLADWVAYRLDSSSLKGRAGGKRKWQADPWLDDGETLEPEDYIGASEAQGLDRGHMAPFGSAGGKKNKAESNYLSNIMPQKSSLNRGLWKQLEDGERKLARRGYTLFVMAGPLYEKPMKSLPGADEAHRIPSGFWKIIILRAGEGYDGIRAAAFIFDQGKNKGPLLRRLCTIREVERRSGLDFLWMLPKKIENKIESTLYKKWVAANFTRKKQ